MLAPLLTRLASAVPNGAEVVPAREPTALSAGTPAPVVAAEPPALTPLREGRGACAADPISVTTPRVPLLLKTNQFTPSALPASRLASRKRTLSITCCEGDTFMALTTGESGDKPLATDTARSAETASVASPLRTT